ncbi:hypothetical protein [Streptomyces sp. NPDC002156]
MELARTSIGLVAAFTVPTAFDWHSRRPWYVIVFTLFYGALAVAPSGVGLKEVAVLFSLTLASACLALLKKPETWKLPSLLPAWKKIRPNSISTLRLSRMEYGAAIVGTLSILLPIYLGFDAGLRFVRRNILDNDQVIIVFSGMLIAVFGCQQVIGRVVRPLVEKILEKIKSKEFEEGVGDFIKAGPHVGWIERFILFVFLVSGNPAPAALVVTAKSLARFPEIQQAEKLVGDYYLVGTLTSVAVALVASGITRMALGMPPL